jgi:adenine-specific DNA-methyltransferase
VAELAIVSDVDFCKDLLMRRRQVMDGPKMQRPLARRERDRERESKKLLARARRLRRECSDAEILLWHHLRARRLLGYKFRRQVVIEPYIVDFVCLEASLIIEADGGQHSERLAYDVGRTVWLENMGYRVIRFWNHEILGDLQSVLEQIRAVLIGTPSPQPSPAGRGSTVPLPLGGARGGPSPDYTQPGHKFNFCFFERDADERRYTLIFYIYARYSGAGSLRSSAKTCAERSRSISLQKN